MGHKGLIFQHHLPASSHCLLNAQYTCSLLNKIPSTSEFALAIPPAKVPIAFCLLGKKNHTHLFVQVQILVFVFNM